MKFQPSLHGYYKRSWVHNNRFEEVKKEIRTGNAFLIYERLQLEQDLVRHVQCSILELHARTRFLLSNPTWRRLILRARWSTLARRRSNCEKFFL